MQSVFHACASVGGGVAESLFRDGLCLPSGANLIKTDLDRVAGIVRSLGRWGRRADVPALVQFTE